MLRVCRVCCLNSLSSVCCFVLCVRCDCFVCVCLGVVRLCFVCVVICVYGCVLFVFFHVSIVPSLCDSCVFSCLGCVRSLCVVCVSGVCCLCVMCVLFDCLSCS